MTEPQFPEPLDDDDDDVAWAVQTAKVQWNRGGRADAIVWLRRAADSADRLSNVWRAADLRRIADQLTSNLVPADETPEPPLPQWPSASASVKAPSAAEASGVTSIPPRAALTAVASSYAPVDDLEVEVEYFDDEQVVADDPESNARIAQLLGNEAELTSEVDVMDEEELDDIIDDDALSLPPISSAPSTDPQAFDLADEVGDDPVTQPQLEEPRLLDLPRRSPRPPARPSSPPPEPHVGDVLLAEVRGLEDVPPEGQAILAREAIIKHLAVEEEIRAFGLALVVRGAVSVMPAIADLACARASKGEIVWSQGNLAEGIALRLVAVEDSTEVAVWAADLLKSTVRDYPWVVEDLKALADRFQALAGIAMGPMGERLDDSVRAMVADQCEIKRLLPGEILTKQGKPVGGMYVVAAGRIEVLAGDAVESELGPGDFLFAPQVLSNGAAPSDSRAGSGGALLLFAGRAVSHNLLLSVPPLLEIFAT
jgi:CRP-like cAMP-binding protein